MVLVASDTTFSQMMAKAFATCKVSCCEYDIRMTGWFAYEKKDPLPPIPLQNDDDIRVLLRLNSDQTLSVPLCLVISKKASDIVTPQIKIELLRI